MPPAASSRRAAADPAPTGGPAQRGERAGQELALGLDRARGSEGGARGVEGAEQTLGLMRSIELPESESHEQGDADQGENHRKPRRSLPAPSGHGPLGFIVAALYCFIIVATRAGLPPCGPN